MPLDPQVASFLARAAELGVRPYSEMAVEEGRALLEAGAAAQFGPVAGIAEVRDISVAGVPVRLYDPEPGARLPIVAYFHGGGWVVGSIESVDGVCRALADRGRCRVVSAGYRLAPEHRFPAAVDDCWAVTRWAFEEAPRVAVAGDSAGGNLAAVMAHRARDAGLELALQVLVYPVVAHDLTTASYRANADGYGLTLGSMRWFWDHYLGGADGSHPEASPLGAPDLAGLAPALVVVCEFDVLHDEGVAYAERLRSAGVPARLSDYEGMIHGTLRMPALVDRSESMLDECAAAIREAFAGA